MALLILAGNRAQTEKCGTGKFGFLFKYCVAENKEYAPVTYKSHTASNANATLSASLTGTAFPICLKAVVLDGTPVTDSK